ncbi:MAG: hypothetical protein KKH72_07675 [Alphaproteobacteria bacterium]|nr:hypothetical protein [Alphaproteobacteria bacterium]
MTDEPDWTAIRADYEAGMRPVADICAQYAVEGWRLYQRCEAEGWPRRRAARATTRSALVTRLYRLLERQITELEMKTDDLGDKEAAILGTLTRNLEKLADLDRKEQGERKDRPKRTDIAVLRRKLAERIDRLTAN